MIGLAFFQLAMFIVYLIGALGLVHRAGQASRSGGAG